MTELPTIACQAYSQQRGLTYSLIDEPIVSKLLNRAFYDGHIVFSDGYRKRFIDYIVQDLPNVALRELKEAA